MEKTLQDLMAWSSSASLQSSKYKHAPPQRKTTPGCFRMPQETLSATSLSLSCSVFCFSGPWTCHKYSWLKSKVRSNRAPETIAEGTWLFVLLPLNARAKLRKNYTFSNLTSLLICLTKDISMLHGFLISKDVKVQRIKQSMGN